MNYILNEIQTKYGVKGIIIINKAGNLMAITGNIATFNTGEFNIDCLPKLVKIINDLNLQQNGIQFSFSNLYLDIRIFPEGYVVMVCEPEIDIAMCDLSMRKILINLKNI